jgi:hypothetical protein
MVKIERFSIAGMCPESNLLELARGLVRELFPNSFSISFSQAADWQRFCDLGNNVAFCQSAAREKEIEKEFGNNSRTSPLASSKRLDSGQNHQFQRGWNVSWSKSSVSAGLGISRRKK